MPTSRQTGQIEVTTTPYAHPILPLIYDNQLALVGNPSAIMPDLPFSYPQDAEAHLAISVEMYEENFGQSVRGLWPGEGSVAQVIVPLVAGSRVHRDANRRTRPGEVVGDRFLHP